MVPGCCASGWLLPCSGSDYQRFRRSAHRCGRSARSAHLLPGAAASGPEIADPIVDLGQAANAWGAHRQRVRAGQRSGRRAGFPRFKRRRHEQGFRANNGPDTVRVDDKVVILPKIGKVAVVEHPRFAGSIREVTVNRTPGTWFARCCVEAGEGLPAVQSGPTIGVDVGVGLMATCRDCGDWTRPSPAVGTSTAAAITPTGARSRTPGDGDFMLGWSMLGWSMLGMTITTRQRRR